MSLRRFLRRFVSVVLLSLLTSVAVAQSVPYDTTRTYVIGTKSAPPFVFQQADGRWTGLSIELWQDIAADLGVRYRWQETDLAGLLDGVQADTLDAAVAALTITAEREQEVDFTHPFVVSGLGIAVQARQGTGWVATIRQLVSINFIKVVGALLGLLLLVGMLVWLFERRKNPEQFGGSAGEGIVSGFWWSAVTMTTVGYGDKAPTTLGGRLLAIVWMFTAIILVSSFTAAITSALTVSRLEGPVQGPDDLPGARVGSIPASTSASYLERHRVGFLPVETPADGLAALAAGEIEAFVYDAPILQYLIKTNYEGTLRVLPNTFERQYYGFALPKDSPLREPVNRVLLQTIEQPAWRERLFRYLGE